MEKACLDYKLRDTERIITYLKNFPKGIEVDDLIAHSGAEKLRVYPALFELEQAGLLEVMAREDLGAPKKVRWLYNNYRKD